MFAEVEWILGKVLAETIMNSLARLGCHFYHVSLLPCKCISTTTETEIPEVS